MVSPVIAKIISVQQSFTVIENEIAQYVMNNAEKVVSSTITTIAKNTNTSEASINRFCKKIGFKGFNSFKVALAQENFFNSMQKSEQSSTDDGLVSSISRDYSHMLVNTTALLDENLVQEAAAAMRKAAHIYIFSYSYTAMVAQELEFRLGMVGLHAKAVTDIEAIRVYTGAVTGDDLVMVLAPTLLMRDLYHAMGLCRDSGAKIMTISSYDSPKLAAMIDCKFIISDKITTRYSVSISNNLMFLYVTDVLYCALLEGDKSLKKKRMASDSILSSQQRMDSYFFEY